MHLEFPAANLGPAMGSLVRENQPTTLCLVDSDSRRRSQRPSRRLSTRRRPRGFGSPVWGTTGRHDSRRPRRLLARLSNSCDVLNLRQAGLGASHQGLIAATCRQSFRQQGSFGISRYTAAPWSGIFAIRRVCSTRRLWKMGDDYVVSRETAASPQERKDVSLTENLTPDGCVDTSAAGWSDARQPRKASRCRKVDRPS